MKKTKAKPTKWNLYKDGITQSMISEFMTCPAKFHNSYIRMIKPTSVNAGLIFGDVFHSILENVYTQRRDTGDLNRNEIKDIINASINKRTDHWREHVDTAGAFKAPKDVRDMFDAIDLAGTVADVYFQQWRRMQKKYTWISLEEVFKVKYKIPSSGNYTYFRGKIDGVVQLENGDHYLFETKTKGYCDMHSITATLPYNFQVLFYAAAYEKLHDVPIKGVIYNIIRRPGQRGKIGEDIAQLRARVKEEVKNNPDYYFYQIFHDMSDKRGKLCRKVWKEELAEILGSIENVYTGEGVPYRNINSCTLYGLCPYSMLCSTAPAGTEMTANDISTNPILLQRKRSDLFSELKVE